MTTQSDVIPVKGPRFRVRTRVGIPPLRTVILGLVALLILFRWLHLILALQTATYGRDVQIRTEELMRLERQNNLLRSQIAEAESPLVLSERGLLLGLIPRTPVYLPVEVTPPEGGDGEPSSDAALLCPGLARAHCLPDQLILAAHAPGSGAMASIASISQGYGVGSEVNRVH